MNSIEHDIRTLENNIRFYKEQAESCAKQLEEAKKRLEEQKNRQWVPRSGGEFFYVHEISRAVARDVFMVSHPIDRARLARGNVFATREEVEKAARRLQAMDKLTGLAGGFKPDWNSEKQDKWYIYYDGSSWAVRRCHTVVHPGTVYFATLEAVLEARQEMGDLLNDLL